MTTANRKKILLNAFNMNCVGHINHGLWTHPRDRSAHYTDLDYWADLAKTLERGKFDGIFLADIVGVYDVFGGGRRAARIGAGARQRSAAARARDGAGHAAPRLRRDREPHLRAALPVRAPHVDARSPDERARGLEHRHRLSRQRRARDGPRAADRPRRPLRARGRLHGRRLQAVGTELGRRCGDPRREGARVRAAGQGAAREARRAVLFDRRDSSERAVAAAHAGAVPRPVRPRAASSSPAVTRNACS